jgi:hypothetical protein
LRFVAGRPLSGVTTQYLAWCCARAVALGKTALLLVWDNASWHVSAAVRTWLRANNQQVKATGAGVRILVCPLPTKSPWLNPIEPKWVHGKRAVVEPDGLLPAAVLEERVCDYYGCPVEPHLTIPQAVAGSCTSRLLKKSATGLDGPNSGLCSDSKSAPRPSRFRRSGTFSSPC